LKNLNYELKQLCRRNRDGSYATQHAREAILTQIANQLVELGFKDMKVASLKPKHVCGLVQLWKSQGLSAGTIKNRMTELRWWAEKVNKANVMARDNDGYGIARRVYATNTDKSRTLTDGDLTKITDPCTHLSLKLQAGFGMRREESIKFRPQWADGGDRLFLKASWTKGGRAREIPIRTEQQRMVLDEAKRLAGKGSLIPPGMSYKEQLERFKAQCQAAGIYHVHGLRHKYAQDRYRELTGWLCPAQGGPKSKELTLEQKGLDRQARLTISAELGHGREGILTTYIGR
jgi:site-specific recombinase XerC